MSSIVHTYRSLPAATALVWTALAAAGLFGVCALEAAPGAQRTVESDAMYARALGLDDVRAIKTLIRARRLAPQDERIIYRIGFLFHKMNRRPEARQAYENTIELMPCHTRALNNVGNILKDQGLRAAAMRRYREAIGCDPGFSVAHYNLANLYRKAKQYATAVRHYEAALDAQPDHYRSHHNLGLIYLRLARRAAADPTSQSAAGVKFSRRALVHLDRACELNPRDAINFYNRGRLYELHADRSRAVSDYKRALGLLRANSAFKDRLRKRIQRLQLPRAGEE